MGVDLVLMVGAAAIWIGSFVSASNEADKNK